MCGLCDRGWRPRIRLFVSVGLITCIAFQWSIPARGQSNPTKLPPDSPPAQTPAAPSPDYTLTTSKLTIQYKTKRLPRAQMVDLELVAVSPAEVVIKGSRNGSPMKDQDWIKAVFTVSYKNRSGDYTSSVISPDPNGEFKVAMKDVATKLLGDISGMLPGGFDPAAAKQLEIGKPCVVSIRVITPSAKAGQAAELGNKVLITKGQLTITLQQVIGEGPE